MSRSPNRKDLCSYHGSKMHIGGIHTNKQIKLTNKGKLLIESVFTNNRYNFRIFISPFTQYCLFKPFATEKENSNIFFSR